LDETPTWDWESIRRRCALEARRILRDPADVEDVVQEAMIRAWSRRESCRSPEGPLPWCLQITRREALRRLARRRTAREQMLLEVTDRAASEEPDRAIDRIDLGRAVAHLQPDDQVLIALRYSRDYSQPEIARTLRIPEGTAKVRLHRARKRLETLMEQAA
jgi:RNA polymerase sigma-70 factor (ECF subfamily)